MSVLWLPGGYFKYGKDEGNGKCLAFSPAAVGGPGLTARQQRAQITHQVDPSLAVQCQVPAGPYILGQLAEGGGCLCDVS